MLMQGSTAYNLHYISSVTLDAACAAGVVSADYADEWDWRVHGSDIEAVAYDHPWRRYNQGVNVWVSMNDLITEALEPIRAGFDSSGTFVLRSVLASDYSVPISEQTVTGASDIMTPLQVDKAPRYNHFVGHGVNINKATRLQLMWDARSSNLFTDESGIFISEDVVDGESWPQITTTKARELITGEFWARYGGEYQTKEQMGGNIFSPIINLANKYGTWVPVEAELSGWQKFWRGVTFHKYWSKGDEHHWGKYEARG